MKAVLSELAESKLLILSTYLTENWSLQVKNNFFKKLANKVHQIESQPYSCIESFEFKGLYKCVVTKQTTFYYRISEKQQEIEIITIFDTRQNPNKLYKDL
ncbi:type II toxin-antitoxin system RelE/ParE family toxin [uncultured Polaribacter sp.]|uniref:type II toxin-antitoxin system RelE/ParE family toxin n=1 Tax=uncultured Polaribacter sp. TaxID=174711 RepID=UPI00261B7EF9|nr:type II toxin-antitoxin system RelE/ParE family toxin [uncultured Polaribacter sp.]